MIRMDELLSDPDFVQPVMVSVLRHTGSYDGHGLYIPNEPQTLKFTMIIQQSTQKALDALLEGERNQAGDYITCWSHSKMICAEPTDDQQSDIVLWRNKYYRIIKCADRSDNGFWEAIAQAAPNTGRTVSTEPEPEPELPAESKPSKDSFWMPGGTLPV